MPSPGVATAPATPAIHFLFGGVVPLLSDGPGCADFGACFSETQDFNGDKRRIDQSTPCCDWLSFSSGFSWKSAKNRYGQRKVQMGNALTRPTAWTRTKNGQGLDYSDRFKLGVLGSHCGS